MVEDDPPPAAAPPVPAAAPPVPAAAALPVPAAVRPPIPAPVRAFNRDNLKKNNHILWTTEEMVFPAKVTTSGTKLLIQKMQPVSMPGFREVTFMYCQKDFKEN